MTAFSGASRPLRARRAIALVVLSLLLAGLGAPVATADTDPAPTAVDRFYVNGYGASIMVLLIGEGVYGTNPTFAVSAPTSGTELHLVGGPECHRGLCSQWANYSSPDTLPASSADDFTYTIADSNGTSDPAPVGITYSSAYARPQDGIQRLNPRTPGTVTLQALVPQDHGVRFWPSRMPMTGDLGPVGAATCESVWPGWSTCTATATYTPQAGLTSRDSDYIYWQVEDTTTGDFSATAYAVLTFENAPVAHDDTISVPNDRTSTLALTANDTDIDGDVLSVAYRDVPEHGVLRCDATCTYTPDAGYVGPDSFTYWASDGQWFSESTATVQLTVTVPPPPPPAPVLCLPGAPAIRSVAPGARRGPLTAVVSWSAPSTACTGTLSRFTVKALKVSRSGAVLGSRTYTAAGTARRLEVRLPSARSWRFQVSATGARGTGAASRPSATVVAR